MSKTYKGRFKPRNPDKYKGDPENIIYRSSWERDVMMWMDRREDILWWQSEEKCVWYYDPITKKKRRYFPDFIFERVNKDGIRVTEVIEVKPASQVKGPPQNPKRKTKSWANAVQTYVTNQAKWNAMVEVCENNGWNFRLLTEQDVKQWR